MINLLKWLLCPVFYFGGGKGDGGAAQREQEEEARKQTLRQKIDALYGITRTDARPTPPTGDAKGLLGRAFQQAALQLTPAKQAEYDTDVANAAAANTQMEGENAKLADATRSYYTDQLGKDYTTAERKTRFKLARQGLLGGSEDVNQQGLVKSDRDLGATRVDDAVARAVAQLKTQREGERANAVSLVNSGAGESAVSAAQTGLHNSFDNAASAQKQELFTDLFANAADAGAASNANAQEAAYLSRYRDRLGTFFPTTKSTGGRVTAS